MIRFAAGHVLTRSTIAELAEWIFYFASMKFTYTSINNLTVIIVLEYVTVNQFPLSVNSWGFDESTQGLCQWISAKIISRNAFLSPYQIKSPTYSSKYWLQTHRLVTPPLRRVDFVWDFLAVLGLTVRVSTEEQMDATKCIISPALQSITRTYPYFLREG